MAEKYSYPAKNKYTADMNLVFLKGLKPEEYVRAGEEGIGVLAFLLKLFLRFAPVQFGVNASLGALGLVAALCMLLAGGSLAAQSDDC